LIQDVKKIFVVIHSQKSDSEELIIFCKLIVAYSFCHFYESLFQDLSNK